MRGLFILLVMLLAGYPIIELTMIIWFTPGRGFYYRPELFSTFLFETIYMWAFYLCIIPVLLWRLRK